MRLPRSKRAGLFMAALGFAGLSVLAFDFPFRFIGFGLGLPPLVVAMGLLGKPGQYARVLQTFEAKTVQVEVWGRGLPGSEGLHCVDSIAPMGLGLWIYLRPAGGGPRLKLKIAQPTLLDLQPGSAGIHFAGYAQWDSKRIKGPDGQRAPGKVVLQAVI